MNPRIEELAVQARIQMVSEPRLQEFADLVVQDCIQVIKTMHTQCPFTTHDQGMVDCARIRFIDGIKEHFKK